MRRAHGQRVSMNRNRRNRCFVAVQRLPQLGDFRVEAFQLDDVVVVYAARSAEVASGRPVRVESATVGQPPVGQKPNELDERHAVLGTFAYR